MKHLLSALLLLLLLAACGESHEQMLLQLEELERRNCADSLMLNDSLALRLADYFDRHGTANERLRAHYILGRTYADMGEAPAALNAYLDAAASADTTCADCDYRTLSRVYGQMADVFYWQNLMEDYLRSLDKSVQYAWKDKDTLQALNEEAHKVAAYNRLEQLDKVIVSFDEIYNRLLQAYGVEYASKFCILPVYALLEKGHLEKAKKYIDIYQRKSGYFDAEGNVEKGREVCYFYFGMYYLQKQQTDSAELYFLKELRSGIDADNQQMASHGLSMVYKQKRLLDSALYYALYSHEMLDSVFARKSTSEVERIQALYNYSRHQTIASQEHLRADSERDEKIILIVIVLATFVLILTLLTVWRRKRKTILLEYERKVGELQSVKADLNNLQALETEKSNLQAFSERLFHQIAAKEAAVGDLQIEIAKLKKDHFPATSDSERLLGDSEVYRMLHKAVKCEQLTEDQWQEIDSMVKSTLPGFYRFVSSLPYTPESNEYRICILLRLHLRMQDAGGFIGISKSRLSQISTAILGKVFTSKGSGKELQRVLESIE